MGKFFGYSLKSYSLKSINFETKILSEQLICLSFYLDMF